MHSSNKPSELSQWPTRDDSTVNIGTVIIIIIIILMPTSTAGLKLSKGVTDCNGGLVLR